MTDNVVPFRKFKLADGPANDAPALRTVPREGPSTTSDELRAAGEARHAQLQHEADHLAAHRHRGAKYTGWRDAAAVAKNIRRDVAEAVKTGALPKGLKVAARSHKFSMGQSVDVEVTAVPPDFPILNLARVRIDARAPHAPPPHGVPRLTKRAQALVDALEAIADAYNERRSDKDQMYYLDVRFAHELTKRERDEMVAALRAYDAAREKEATSSTPSAKRAKLLATLGESLARWQRDADPLSAAVPGAG